MQPAVSFPRHQFNMAAIRSQDTKPELLVRQYLHRAGLRFRLHAPELAGRPDIYLPRHRVAILVHGCFWHGHEGCRFFRLPEKRRDHWVRKIGRTVARDWQGQRQLEQDNIRVLVVWECELRASSREATLSSLLARIIAGETTVGLIPDISDICPD